MNWNEQIVKIEVTIPLESVGDVRNAILNEGAGIIGNYTYCSVSTKCVGTFMPVDDAKPYIGEINKIEFVEEEKLEVVCDINIAKIVLNKIREVHPYEEPVIIIIPLFNEENFNK